MGDLRLSSQARPLPARRLLPFLAGSQRGTHCSASALGCHQPRCMALSLDFSSPSSNHAFPSPVQRLRLLPLTTQSPSADTILPSQNHHLSLGVSIHPQVSSTSDGRARFAIDRQVSASDISDTAIGSPEPPSNLRPPRQPFSSITNHHKNVSQGYLYCRQARRRHLSFSAFDDSRRPKPCTYCFR